jgi:hypothetical protein
VSCCWSCTRDKTFIGRIARGFDFLGYWFSPAGLGVAPKTVERFVERVSRLYEQGADLGRIGEYVRRWWLWVRSGVRKFLGAIRRESIGESRRVSLSPSAPLHARRSHLPYRVLFRE